MRGWILFFLWSFGIWLFVGVFLPFVHSFIPAWQRYTQVMEEENIDGGAMYYSNVAQTQEAEAHIRQVVKDAMKKREEKEKQK